MKAHELLERFNQNSREHEQELRRIKDRISECTEKEVGIRHEIAIGYRRFAAAQINENNRIDSDIEWQMKMRKQETENLRKLLEESEVFIERETHAAKEMQERLNEARALVQSTLSQNPRYAALYERHKAIEEQGACAASLEQRMIQECEAKLPPFNQSPIYSYLRNQGFGTDAYKANPVVSQIDQWLAKLCQFNENWQNEQALLAIPGLIEEARAQREAALIQAEDERNELEVEISGEVRELTRLVRTKQSLINQAKKQASSIQAQLDSFASKSDSYYLKAIEIMSQELSGASTDELRARASETIDKADDIAMAEIAAANHDLEALEREVRELNAHRIAALELYEHAKRAERRIRNSSLSLRETTFDASLDVDTLIKAYMSGTLSEVMLINAIRSAQTNEAKWEAPTHSSASMGSTWNPATAKHSDNYVHIGNHTER